MITVGINDIVALAVQSMQSSGVPQHEAEIAASIYLEAELWGRQTHGFRYLATNLAQYRDKLAQRRELALQQETASSALLDGGYHFPVFVHDTAMKLAIKKAKTSGIGLVGVRNAGLSGLLGYYTQLAAEAGLIGIACNTTPSLVVPPGGTTPLLGTNPLSIGIPRPDKAPLIFDISTSAISFSQLLHAQRDATPLPFGVALDRAGEPTVDPFEAVDEANRARLLPFAGYKGFGLALMIELLCNAGVGAPVGQRKFASPLIEAAHSNGLYLAYRPDLFVSRDVFDTQVAQLIGDIKASQRDAGGDEIRIPGERSQQRKVERLRAGYIDIEESTYEFLRSLATSICS